MIKLKSHDACFVKAEGEPLTPGEHVELNGVEYTLPQSYREADNSPYITRAWAVPNGNGQYLAIAEMLLPQ